MPPPFKIPTPHSIAATLGEHFGRYNHRGGLYFIEGLFCTQTVHLGPGRYISQLAFIQGWPLIKRVPLYTNPTHTPTHTHTYWSTGFLDQRNSYVPLMR